MSEYNNVRDEHLKWKNAKNQARTLTINNNHKTTKPWSKVVNPRTKQKQYSYKKQDRKVKNRLYYLIEYMCKCVGVFIIVSILKNIYIPPNIK